MSIEPYQPPRWLAGGHAMTVFTWASPRQFPGLPEPEIRLFDVATDARVMAKCHWQDRRTSRPTLLLLHGLEGSADSHYVRGIAEKAFAAGFNVVRLNQRDCGGTDHLSVASYHSGLTADPVAVIPGTRRPGPSRSDWRGRATRSGGNLALKLAGEFGETPPASAEGGRDRLADARPRRLRRRHRAAVELVLPAGLRRVAEAARQAEGRACSRGTSPRPTCPGVRTIREFDERYTSRLHGFGNAANYYYQASSLRVVAPDPGAHAHHHGRGRPVRAGLAVRRRRPSPGIRTSGWSSRRTAATAGSSRAGRTARGDRYWAERAVVDFVGEFLR